MWLADSSVARAWYAYLPAKEAFPPAKKAVTRALELDPGLAEAHTTLAFINLYYDWNWDAADREFRRAIELNPNYANAHHWYAEYLSLVGQHEAAIREAQRARELDPLSSIINTWVGSRYFFARKYDMAAEQYRNVLEQDPISFRHTWRSGKPTRKRRYFGRRSLNSREPWTCPAAARYM